MTRLLTLCCGLLLFASTSVFSQGTNCQTADPFCTGSPANFPAGVNAGYAQTGANYGCLYTQPNPAWYYMQVATSGTIELEMHSVPAHDIDFACWGPFNSPTSPCVAQLTAGPNTPTHAVPGPSPYYPTQNMIDCSYSIYATEYVYIPNAVTGQFYILLITNYSNQTCDITFSQTGGTGTTSCTILPYAQGDSVCLGDSIHLNVLIPTPGATYHWTGPLGFDSYQQNPVIPNATFAMTGTYTLVMTIGGVQQPPVNVSVYVSSFPTISILPANPTVCKFGSTTLTGSSNEPGTTYVWSTGQSGSSISVNPLVPTTYSVTGTTAGGCSGSATTTVTVLPIPIVSVAGNFPTPPGQPYLCGGNSILLNAQGADTYVWSHSLGTSNPITVTPPSTITYTVTGTAANGCTGSATIYIQSVGPTMSFGAPPPTMCQGASANITVGGANSYAWSHGVVDNEYNDPFPFWKSHATVSPAATTTYTITGTDNGGCTASATITVTITPGNPVSVNVTSSPPMPVCSNTTVTFTATPTNGGTAPSYQWMKNGVNVGTGTTYVLNPPLNNGDVIYCILTSNVNCPLGNPATSNSIVVNVQSTLPASVNIAASPPGPICTGTNVVFTATPTNGGVPTYQWYSNGSPIGGQTGSTYSSSSLTNGQVITCVMTSSLGCATGSPATSNTYTMSVSPVPNPTITPAGPFCMDHVPLNLTAADTGGVWTGAGITNSSLGTFNPAVAGPGTHAISYMINNSPCPDTGHINITVAALVNATIMPAGPFCISDPMLTLISVSGGGTWTGQGIIDAMSGIFDPLTAGPGNHQISYAITGTCSDTGYINIQVNAIANATINAAGPFCTTQLPVTLTAGTIGGVWTGTGIIDDSLGIFSPAVAGQGTHAITYMISTGACADTGYTNIAVSTTPDGTINPAGPYCSTDPAVNLTAGTSGGTWSGTGITNPANGTFNPGTANLGSNLITYIVNNGNCADTGTMTIMVSSQYDATINNPGTICSDWGNITLTAHDPGGTWSGTGIVNASLGTFSPTLAGPGPHTITYTVGIGLCADMNQLTINVTNAPDATINPAGPFCSSAAPLNLTAVSTGGTWSGTGITNATNGTFNPGIGVGTYTITYIIGGVCPDTGQIAISVIDQADATITPAGPYCVSGITDTLHAADPGGVWSGAGITNASLGIFNPATAGVGTHNIIYAINAGQCSDDDTISITVAPAVNANITAAGPFCETNSAVNLSAVTPGGVWSGAGITNSTLGTFNPQVAGPGVHLIVYTITGVCSATGLTNITVDSIPWSNINPSGPYCTNTPPVTLTAVTPGGTWSGTGITNTTLGVFSPAVAGQGTFTITYLVANGLCSSSSQASITVNNVISAAINPAGPYCLNDPATNLTAVNPGGTWSGPGITNASLGTFDPSVAGSGSHIIEYALGGQCPDTGQITVIVNASFDATINPAGPYCTNDAIDTLTAADAGGAWTGTGITNSSLGIFNPSVAGAGTHTITYIVGGVQCADTATYNITVNAASDATISAAGPYCSADAAVTLTAADPGGTWSGTGITSGSLGTFDPAVAGTGVHSVIYSIGGACPDADTIDITVNQQPDASITPVGNICQTNNILTLHAADTGGIWSGDPAITDPLAGSFDPMTAGLGAHEIHYTISGACPATDSILVTVVANVSLDATVTPESCTGKNNGAIDLNIVTGTPAYDISWSTGGSDEDLSDLTPGDYVVIVVDDNGCRDTLSLKILGSEVACESPAIYVPNIFSPNGDGKNDVLFVHGAAIQDLDFTIYDRWGELVHSSKYSPNGDGTVSEGWDGTLNGKLMDQAVYVYFLTVTYATGDAITMQGHITLVR